MTIRVLLVPAANAIHAGFRLQAFTYLFDFTEISLPRPSVARLMLVLLQLFKP